VVTVVNTGPVIEPASVPELFQPFHRADSPARCNGLGLGLGLSIVRAVAGRRSPEVDEPHVP
jgi:signal transduction histidine kinase